MEREGGRGQLCVVHVGAQAPPQKSPMPSVEGTSHRRTHTKFLLRMCREVTQKSRLNVNVNFLNTRADFKRAASYIGEQRLLWPHGEKSARVVSLTGEAQM